MTRSSENRCFRRFQQTRDPRLLAKVFDATAAELLRVAGYLSNGDRELTQDALQATFLTAIENADSYDAERDVRPWLLGILANHVRKERRRTVRHQGTDVTEAGLPAKDSPEAQVQGEEFGSAAKAAMKKLPSPFKEAIVLHLQHGLTATEIGEALGRPAGTVRTQIVRGMDRLRALLPAGFTAAALGMMLTPGPVLATVRSNVLATLPPVAVASSSLVLTGWRLYAMIAAGLTVVLSVLFSLLADPVIDPPVPTAEVEQREPELAAADVGTPRALIAKSKAKVAPPAPPQVKPKRPDNLQRVALKVVYKDDGKPAANVPIGMRRNGVVDRWQTDARGRLELFLPWPGRHYLYALGTTAETTFGWSRGERRVRVQKARIEIPRGSDLDVLVTGADGNPIEGATVETIGGRQIGGMLTVLGKTDAAGRFVRRDVASPRQMRVWADGYEPGTMREVGGEVGQACRVEWQLSKRAHAARGRVVDERGLPIANARLALVQLSSSRDQPLYLRSDDQGSFELRMLRTGNHVLVGHHESARLRRGLLQFEHDGFGEKQIELRLTLGARVAGRLTNSAGMPLAMTNMVARSRAKGIGQLPFLETWTRTDADGRFILDALPPSRYDLESDKVETKTVELRDGETFKWNPVRSSLVPISVRLLNAAGEPLEGWRVSVSRPGTQHPDSSNVTGSDGRLLYVMRSWSFKPGGYCRFFLHKKLEKENPGFGFYSLIPNLVTPPMAVGQEHEIRVPDSARSIHSLRGVIQDHTGAVMADAMVEMSGRHGRMFSVKASVAEEAGSFAFDGLPAGRYQAYVSAVGRPNYYLPTIVIGSEPVADIGVVKVPDIGRVTVSMSGAVSLYGMNVRLIDSSGRAFSARKQPDGTWRSDDLLHGDYEVRGFSSTALVSSKSFKLHAAAHTVSVTAVAHQATKVSVELPVSYPRDNREWRASLVAREAGKFAAKRKLYRDFSGKLEDRMEFLVQLPPGVLDLRVKCWMGKVATAKVRVPAAGGGEVLMQIQ
jgi:RNA polymerase sigma-70 factor (ECF subfamily)